MTSTNIAVLPTPSSEYIPNADGRWHTANNNSYIPADVPNRTACTYYADHRAGEDYLIKGATLIDLGASVRNKVNSTDRFAPNDMKEAVDSIGISATSDTNGNVILSISGAYVSDNNGNITIS